jgi:hypothetical protein
MEEACQHDGFSPMARIEVARVIEVTRGAQPGSFARK